VGTKSFPSSCATAGVARLVVQDENFRRQPFAVEPVTDRERAQARGHNPKRVDLFAPRERQDASAKRPRTLTAIQSNFFPMLII
jgi:hypothetical protein